MTYSHRLAQESQKLYTKPSTWRKLRRRKERRLAQQALFREGQGAAMGHYEMIQHTYIDQCQGIRQRLGQLPIRVARIGLSRGMIVCKDDGSRIMS